MPIPLAVGAVAPAVGAMGKLGLALKGLFGAGKVAGAAKAVAGGGKLAGIKRFAGKALADYMGPGGVTPTNIATNFGPDIFFGAMQGAMTPGDLGDKLIAGTTTAVGGAMGGVGAVSVLPGAKTNAGMRMLAEMGGGYGGDMMGQMVGDGLLRAKGGGTTPWEKLQQEGDQQYRQQLEREILAKYGIGGYNVPDLFMSENGLA